MLLDPMDTTQINQRSYFIGSHLHEEFIQRFNLFGAGNIHTIFIAIVQYYHKAIPPHPKPLLDDIYTTGIVLVSPSYDKVDD